MDIKAKFQNSDYGLLISPVGKCDVKITPQLLGVIVTTGIELDVQLEDLTIIGNADTGFYKMEVRKKGILRARLAQPFDEIDNSEEGFDDLTSEIYGIPSTSIAFWQFLGELVRAMVKK